MGNNNCVYFDGSLVDIQDTVSQQHQTHQMKGQSPEMSKTGPANYSLLDMDICANVEPKRILFSLSFLNYPIKVHCI